MFERVVLIINMIDRGIMAAKILGIEGLTRSLYYSWKYGRRFDDFVVGKNVLTRIDRSAEVEIDSRFVMGAAQFPASNGNLENSKIEIDSGATFTVSGKKGRAVIGPGSVVYVSGEFSIGSSYFNSNARIVCNNRISIGDNCAIAWNVQLIDNDQHTVRIDGEPKHNTGPIVIEDNVWIGHDVTIKKGVRVGSGSVVASNSVLTDDVPPETLVAGIPATVLREDVEWSN